MKKLIVILFLFFYCNAQAIDSLEIHGVPIQCINHASVAYNVPAALIISVLAVEDGNVGDALLNKNGTFSYGPMKINSFWLSKVKYYGYSEEKIKNDPCANVMVGAWILSMNIADSTNLWEGVGKYHSNNPKENKIYAHKVSIMYKKLADYLTDKKVYDYKKTEKQKTKTDEIITSQEKQQNLIFDETEKTLIYFTIGLCVVIGYAFFDFYSNKTSKNLYVLLKNELIKKIRVERQIEFSIECAKKEKDPSKKLIHQIIGCICLLCSANFSLLLFAFLWQNFVDKNKSALYAILTYVFFCIFSVFECFVITSNTRRKNINDFKKISQKYLAN